MELETGDLICVKLMRSPDSPRIDVGIIMSFEPPVEGHNFWIISYYSSEKQRIVYESFKSIDLDEKPRVWTAYFKD